MVEQLDVFLQQGTFQDTLDLNDIKKLFNLFYFMIYFL